MKKTLLFSMTLAAGFALSNAASLIISASGVMYTPMIDTIKTTDTVTFTLNSTHNALEVSQTTYNGNGTTALSGGFSVPFSGGKLSASGLATGSHYYVCTNHASLGMKGILFVQAATAIATASTGSNGFTFQIAGAKPIAFDIAGETASLAVLDIKGRKLFSMNMGRNGFRNYAWDGMLANGNNLSAGTYFVQLTLYDAAQKPVGKVSRTLVELH